VSIRSLLFVAAVLLVGCDSAPEPTAGVPDVSAVALSCWSVDDGECGRALAAAAGLLPAGHQPIVTASVVAFGCDFQPCGVGLRRGGSVSIEFANGGGLHAWSIAAARDGSLSLGDHSTGLPQPFFPQSQRIARGESAFGIGHCGLSSPIDVDGSFWDPVGRVDSNAPEAIGDSRGTFRLLDADHATYRADTGFTVALRRHAGAKNFQGCA
jgi:hypothetical protein